MADNSRRLTTGRWEQAVNRALERVNRLSPEDKLAIALHDFAAVTAEDFVPFDYCDGANGVRGGQGATAFPSTWRSLLVSTRRSLTATVPAWPRSPDRWEQRDLGAGH